MGAILLLSGVSLDTVPPPAQVGSVPIEAVPSTDGWATQSMEIDATVIGVSWSDKPPARVWVRASDDGHTWGGWVQLVTELEDHGPDSGTAEAAAASRASDPVWVGDARFVQYRGTGPLPKGLRAEYVEATGRNLSLMERLGLFVQRISWGKTAPASAQPLQPVMVGRAEWGGDACVGPNPHETHYANRVEMLFVHHTEGSGANSYSPEEAMALVYAICSYHVDVRGWSDIGYNFLIDRYGTVYEGRAGGADLPVLGAHTGGFNSYSTGVAFMGDHRTVAPTSAAQEAFESLAAWKLDVHHVDPSGVTTVESFGSTKWDKGVLVQFPTIAGHRDASATTCPGDLAYSLLGAFRSDVAGRGGPKIYGSWPDSDPIEGSPDTGYLPATFTPTFTEPMSWTLTINDLEGAILAQTSGNGDQGSFAWDGGQDGAPLPVGDYRVEVVATPLSGAPPPRPAFFQFQLGSFIPPFSDDEGSIHEPDINTIATTGITQGCGYQLYCPHQTVTRWQMALFLTRLWAVLGYETFDVADQGFTDIAALPLDVQAAINQLAQLGITTGTSPTTFDPEGEVTRWQMALFLTRLWALSPYLLPAGSDQGFVDIAHLSPDVQIAINQLAQLAITTGTSPDTYEPAGVVTREQMASFLVRILAGLGWIEEDP